MQDRIGLLQQDYQDLEERTIVVSIEMIEAVGHAFLPDYFDLCGETGRARIVLQASPCRMIGTTAIQNQRFPEWSSSSCCPCGAMRQPPNGRTRTDRLEAERSLCDDAHLATTFNAAEATLSALGIDDALCAWELRLSYCAPVRGRSRSRLQLVFAHAAATPSSCRHCPRRGVLMPSITVILLTSGVLVLVGDLAVAGKLMVA